MNDYELVEVLARMDSLWPRHGMTPEAKAVIAEKIRRCSRQSAIAVLDEVFATHGGRFPKVERIVAMCRETFRAQATESRREAMYEPERSTAPLSSDAWLALAGRVTGWGHEMAMSRYERALRRENAAGSVGQ